MTNRIDRAAGPAPGAQRPCAGDGGELQRVSRALQALSAGSQALLRARDEASLLDAICRAIVEDGGYARAWVGYALPDVARRIGPVAWAGRGAGFLDDIGMATNVPGAWRAGGPALPAVRPVVVERESPATPGPTPWRNAATPRRLAAVCAFPLRVDDNVIGRLIIVAADSAAFGEGEESVLAELADGLARGIARLRRDGEPKAPAARQRISGCDDLTGLPNRSRFSERLAAAIVAGQDRWRPLALLLISFGNVHEVNEILGYRQGDRLLLELVGRVSAIVAGDQFLARVGETALALLLPEGGADAARRLAQRLVAALDEPLELDGLAVDAGACIGIALFPGLGIDADELLRRAGVATRRARREALDYSVFSSDVDARYTQSLVLMSDLRRAIERRELTLFCQPKVSIASGSVCGAEALVRWHHPDRGVLDTGEFVRLAEHSGLIVPLTRWVLDEAFSQCYRWHEAGCICPISVNLSAHDLRDPRLTERIGGLFATWGAHPEWIQFELTESALMEDPRRALETLKRLKKLDVELFIDDFGTGYSSLSYLQKLPVDAIKIDRSLVAPITVSHDSDVIVRSTIELGHNLDLEVVAEGVESEAAWRRLADLGCDTAQGYYVGPPIPAERFMDWKRESRWQGQVPLPVGPQPRRYSAAAGVSPLPAALAVG